MLKLLYVYRYATFGGVEKVLLSRAEAFKQYGVQVRLSLYFFKDLGAVKAINAYISAAGLEDYVVLVNRFRSAEYDYIISIDTPEILHADVESRKLLFECHSTYIRDRAYLAGLTRKIRLLTVPSAAMKNSLEQERPELAGKITVLRNYVRGYPAFDEEIDIIWAKRPLLYLGRMDEHKNILEVLDIFVSYRSRYGDDLILILVGPMTESIDVSAALRQRHLLARTILLPSVRFDRVKQIHALVNKHKGIFISSSLDESFGLAAAEAIASGLPVLLSGIPAHADLVLDDLDFLYPLGDSAAGAEKLRSIVCRYDEMQRKVERLHGRFSVETFIEDWNCFTALLSGTAPQRCGEGSGSGKS